MTRFLPLALALALTVAAVPVLAQPGEPAGPGSGNASSPPDQDERGNPTTEPEDADAGERGNETGHAEPPQESAEDREPRANESAGSTRRAPDGDAQENGDARAPDESGAGADSSREHGRGRASGEHGVAIEDTPRGFETRAAAGSRRPPVSVDAERAEATVAPESARPLATRLVDVVEFLDENGNGAFDLGETVLARTALANVNATITVDDTNATRLLAYALPGGGELVLRFTLAPADERAGAKFDVIVTDYPFTHEDARLAVGSRVTVPGGVQVRDVDGVPAVAGAEGSRVPYLSWVTTASVDGRDEPVAWSVHVSTTGAGSGEDAIVYWAYAQGAVIVHDPVLGVTEIAEAVLGNPGAFAAGAAGALGALAVGYAARRRSRS